MKLSEGAVKYHLHAARTTLAELVRHAMSDDSLGFEPSTTSCAGASVPRDRVRRSRRDARGTAPALPPRQAAPPARGRPRDRHAWSRRSSVRGRGLVDGRLRSSERAHPGGELVDADLAGDRARVEFAPTPNRPRHPDPAVQTRRGRARRPGRRDSAAPAAPTTRTYASSGGTVTVKLEQRRAVDRVDAAAAGYSEERHDTGPDRVEVRFTNDHDRVADPRRPRERSAGGARPHSTDRQTFMGARACPVHATKESPDERPIPPPRQPTAHLRPARGAGDDPRAARRPRSPAARSSRTTPASTAPRDVAERGAVAASTTTTSLPMPDDDNGVADTVSAPRWPTPAPGRDQDRDVPDGTTATFAAGDAGSVTIRRTGAR